MGQPPATNLKQVETSSNTVSTIEKLIEHELEGKVAERDLPTITARLAEIAVSEQFSGPMPHPKHFREYEDILPGAAERMMSMAERNLEHNMSVSEAALDAEIEDTKRGMRYGSTLIGLLILYGLIVTGNAILPGLFLGGAVIGGITAFIKSRIGKA